MRELQVPGLPRERGEKLTNDGYAKDFGKRETVVHDGSSWKLERLQHFEEKNSPSREALRRGDWQEALRLFEDRHEALRAIALDDERRGYVFHRVRVVEEPLTPYMQWELHSQRQRARYGERIRVLAANELAATETDGRLPEVTIVGEQTLYEVLYTPAGVPDGAVRYTDPDIVNPWVRYLRAAYAAGEDIADYFDRAVAHLPPPPAA